MTGPAPHPLRCLDYHVSVKTKEPIDEDTAVVVRRTINLAIWKTLNECLPKKIDCIVDSSTTTSAEREMLFPNSTDMLLIAHDEWKRREERKRIHPETPWIHGWINGFLTSRKFVQERIAELRAKARER